MKEFNHSGTQLVCGTLLVNDLDRSLEMYTTLLSQKVVEETEISLPLALSWSAPKLAGARACLLQPADADPQNYTGSYLRLIQSAERIEPTAHATSYGWCAFEISVIDVFSLAEKLQLASENTGLKIVGQPKLLDGISNVATMQVVGPDQEVLYLNQAMSSNTTTNLPIANYEVDQFFIAVLATADRHAVVQEYSQRLALDNIETYRLRYSLINRAFALDTETKHELSVLHKGRIPLIEVDQYPSQASSRKTPNGTLPLGNAMVSIAVNTLEDLSLSNTLGAAQQHDELLYGGCRSVVVRGSSNELIEIIEHKNIFLKENN